MVCIGFTKKKKRIYCEGLSRFFFIIHTLKINKGNYIVTKTSTKNKTRSINNWKMFQFSKSLIILWIAPMWYFKLRLWPNVFVHKGQCRYMPHSFIKCNLRLAFRPHPPNFRPHFLGQTDGLFFAISFNFSSQKILSV